MAVNSAPRNSAPSSVIVHTDTDEPLNDLGMFGVSDPDAGSGIIQTTLSVLRGTLTFAEDGGATLTGNGTSSVTLTGTVAQVQGAFGGLDKRTIYYRSDADFFGTDTLTMTTTDNGNTGSGGPQSDTDHVQIIVKSTSSGSSGDDSFVVHSGNHTIDALGGVDTVTFDFRLVDAIVQYAGDKVIIDGPSSHTVLRGVEKFVFTDGTVNNADGNPLVDDLFYYSRNHDVWNAHIDADQHYNQVGWHEGRDPSAFFSTSVYLWTNPDVRAAGVNPLTHFDQIGWREGRVASLAFDPREYLANYSDVAAAHLDPLAHFLGVGAGEGRLPFAPPGELLAPNAFDYVYYLHNNPDVAAAHVDPLWHFQTVGWHEGRNPNALFDTAGYLATYTDVAAANINPLDHYNLVGWREGRDPSPNFDTVAYLAANPDVAAAYVNPLVHYLQYGHYEGRPSFSDGIWG
jgi:serralysin